MRLIPALMLLVAVLAAGCSASTNPDRDVAVDLGTSTTLPARVPAGELTGLPTDSADYELASLIIFGFTDSLKSFNLIYNDAPPTPVGMSLGELVSASAPYAERVDDAIGDLASISDAIRVFADRTEIAARSEDIRALSDEIDAYVRSQRTQNDDARACFDGIEPTEYDRSAETLADDEVFWACLMGTLEIAQSNSDVPERMAKAASLVYDQLIAGVKNP